MAPDRFTETVKDNLTTGRIFPPVVGRIGNLRIAATLMAAEDHGHRGVVLLANTDPNNTRVLRLKGAIGGFVLGKPAGSGGIPWSVEVGLPNQALRSIADNTTYDTLTAQALEPLMTVNGEIVRLQYNERNPMNQPPTLNGVPFADPVHYQ